MSGERVNEYEIKWGYGDMVILGILLSRQYDGHSPKMREPTTYECMFSFELKKFNIKHY